MLTLWLCTLCALTTSTAANPTGNCTGPQTPAGRARLQCHVNDSIWGRRSPKSIQSPPFRMRPTITFKPASSHNRSILHDNGSHSWIGIHAKLVDRLGFGNRFSRERLLFQALQHISKPNYLFSNPRQATIHIPNFYPKAPAIYKQDFLNQKIHFLSH